MSYHIPKEASQPAEDRIAQASAQELEKWANDPNCIESGLCAQEIANRDAKRAEQDAAQPEEPASKRWQVRPFNPRTDVSADATYIAGRIVKHLWIIFVLLPFVLALLLFFLGGITGIIK